MTKGLWTSLAIVVLVSLGTASADDQTNVAWSFYKAIGSNVASRLAAFDHDKNPTNLIEAYKLASTTRPNTNKFHYDRDLMAWRLCLVLTIADKCEKSRDPSFDQIRDMESVHPSFPDVPGQLPPAAGGDPDEIDDPVLRQRYKEAIRLNDLKKERYRHQLALKRIVKEGTDKALRFLGASSMSDATKHDYFSAFTNAITDVGLRERFRCAATGAGTR